MLETPMTFTLGIYLFFMILNVITTVCSIVCTIILINKFSPKGR